MPIFDGSNTREYLERLYMSPLMQSRVQEFIAEFQAAIGSPPEFMFVENPTDALGGVEFSNLILLSGKMYMEFSLNQPNRTVTFLNIDRVTNRVVMSNIQQASFYGQFTESSRLTVQIFTGLQAIGFFEASGDNCGDLLEMTKRYFVPAISG
ncbi:MAG TPA: hypothetical protein VGR45_14145 [Stellaceae bacterium]|nr:hypothetical protein [Stellaceae bacterium]